jgi:alpha-beta hydrolase superfamily lysophospholipase
MPFHAEAASSWRLKSWDRTQIPKPFTTVAMAIGEPLETARAAMIMVHGRGASSESILGLTTALEADGVAFLAPQAYANTWSL